MCCGNGRGGFVGASWTGQLCRGRRIVITHEHWSMLCDRSNQATEWTTLPRCLNVTWCMLIAPLGWSKIGFAVVAAHFLFVHFRVCTFQIDLYLQHGGIQCESVHAVTWGGVAGSMSQLVQGGSGYSICRIRETEMVPGSDAIFAWTTHMFIHFFVLTVCVLTDCV